MKNVFSTLGTIGATVLVMTITGCKTRIADFTLLSTKNVDFSQLEKCQRGNNRVSGSDTKYIIIFIPTGQPHVKDAVDKALESVPGAVALVDGVIYSANGWFIIGANSFTVEGTPLIETGKATASQSSVQGDHLVSYFSHKTHQQVTKAVDAEAFKQLKHNVDNQDKQKIDQFLTQLD